MSWWKFWKRAAPSGSVIIAPVSSLLRTGYVNAAGRDLVDYLTQDDAKSAVIAIRSSGRAAYYLDEIIKHYKSYCSVNPYPSHDLEKTPARLTTASDAIVSAVVRWLRCLPV